MTDSNNAIHLSLITHRSRFAAIAIRVLAVIQLALGLALAGGGAWLLALGGTWYYAVAGIALGVASIYLWLGRTLAIWIELGTLLFTAIWATWEAGLHFWPLIPRMVVPAILTMFALVLAPALADASQAPRVRRLFYGSAALLFVALLGTLGAAFQPHGAISPGDGQDGYVLSMGTSGASDWTHYGRSARGTRFAPFDQINRENVSRLAVAWTFRTGDIGPGEEQNVPLQIGDTIYTCSRNNHIAALDADTGAVRWQFNPHAKSPVWQRCRGLGFFDSSATVIPANGSLPTSGTSPTACIRRIIQTTIDARLIEIDATTGKLCPEFGKGGIVDLTEGMGPVIPGAFFQTSAPTVVRDLVVIGGWVRDNQSRGEPSGVVRAFDAYTGVLRWAWDLGNTAITGEPAPGASYTRGTPNMWSTPSYDDALGLIYLPLGNATPDYYGNGRSAESEKFASSIVALEIASGRPRWHVQTVHHDLWDYDVASQPALYDLPDGKGGVIPALLQTTKRGQLFFLNRATGAPLADIAELPVPQSGHAPTEWLSKTQPYSTEMPAIGAERLTEAKMWGVTPLDQLWCRIVFRSSRYDGDFTPPGLTTSIEYPGNYGGLNWGSVSVDPANGYAFMNDIRIPVLVHLMSPAEVRRIIAKSKGIANRHGPAIQEGTPYGVTIYPMMSPLGIPCSQPPYGTITAVDLKSRQIRWQTPIGTVEDTGPFGVATRMRVPVGMPTIGGTMATASGLVFFAGTQDFYLRALDGATGRELWRNRLPVGSSATPMTYVSPKTGKQYVVISAGGAPSSAVRGDYVIAYALPASRH